MENRRNYYRILQVQPGAPTEIIRASYRTLMQRLKAHPDLGGNHYDATLINEAYAVLTDPARRGRYDRQLQAQICDSRSGKWAAPAMPADADPGEVHCLFCDAPHAPQSAQHADACCIRCGSPLQPATAWQLAASGQRGILRLPRNHELRVFTGWPQPVIQACSRDLSPNGIAFVTRELLPPQAVIKLDSACCQAVARITNIRIDDADPAGSWLVGAEFLSVIFPRSRGSFLSTEA